MLETRIEELTKAVRDLINVMHNQQGVALLSMPQAMGFNKPQNQWTEDEIAQARALQQQNAPLPNETPKSSPATNTSEPSSLESAPATYADVKKLVIAISKTSRDKAVAALQCLGVGNATELKEHQWAAAVAYLGKVAAGEVDPESVHD